MSPPSASNRIGGGFASTVEVEPRAPNHFDSTGARINELALRVRRLGDEVGRGADAMFGAAPEEKIQELHTSCLVGQVDYLEGMINHLERHIARFRA